MKDKVYDCFSFLPGEEEDTLNLEFGEYVEDDSIKIGGNDLGDLYHIILYKYKKDDELDFDSFEAILGCPLEYASHLIPSGFYGIIAKKTTTSDAFASDMAKQIYMSA
jgi:hypothetical protein